MRSANEVRSALVLAGEGLNPCQIARTIGVPRSTVRDWVSKGAAGRRARRIEPSSVPRADYAYLLGQRAVAKVLAPNRASILRHRTSNMVEVNGYSNSLPVLFPQHGAGPKHSRQIVLEGWQQAIVDEHPEAFVRGLIHADGCRVMNKVWHGKYAYPRYFFAQESAEIMGLFGAACTRLGVDRRFTSRSTVSVARAASVELLDSFVGPKA